MKIQVITRQSPKYGEMIVLRNTVLREPLGLPSFTETDLRTEQTDFFVVAFDQTDSMIACCVLTKDGHEVLKLRQMAVLATHQRAGVGREMLNFVEKFAYEKGFHTLVLHARKEAVEFYKKNNYYIVGEEFFEVGIPHLEMEKELN